MINHGDITKVNGAEIEPVDLITFGPPCVDVSVAGQRKGLKHTEKGDAETTRSGLFYDAIRVISEMRVATNGEYPKYTILENVYGLVSSNKGEDFYEVLKEHIKLKDPTIHVPRPSRDRTGKLIWRKAGEILGDGFSIAWRTHCASKWGVPQRRRRVSVIMDFRGHSASEILFVKDSLRGYNSEGGLSWEATSADFKASTRISSTELRLGDATSDGDVGAAYAIDTYNQSATENMCHTLKTVQGGDDIPRVCQPVLCYKVDALSSNSMKSKNPHSGFSVTNCYKTLDTSDQRPEKNQGGVCITQPIALQANGVDRADTAGCNGKGWNDETMYTLTAMDRHCVMAPQVFENHAQDCRVKQFENATNALSAKSGTGGNNLPICAQPFSMATKMHSQNIGENIACPLTHTDYKEPQVAFQPYVLNERQYALTVGSEVANTLTSTDYKGSQCLFQPTTYSEVVGSLSTNDAKYVGNQMVSENKCVVCKYEFIYIVRRITPTECARLQGFPDNHADIGDWTDNKGKLRKGAQSDSHQYKAYGNSIALPYWKWLMLNMREYLPESATHGSLFSGVGGFDLCFDSIYPNGTKWSCEYDDFPSAVLQKRFGGENV